MGGLDPKSAEKELAVSYTFGLRLVDVYGFESIANTYSGHVSSR